MAHIKKSDLFNESINKALEMVKSYSDLPAPTACDICKVLYVQNTSRGSFSSFEVHKHPKGIYRLSSKNGWEFVLSPMIENYSTNTIRRNIKDKCEFCGSISKSERCPSCGAPKMK